MSHETGVGSAEVAFQLEREKHLAANDMAAWRDTSLIYADWLEERDRLADATNVRKEVETKGCAAAPPKSSRWPDVSRLPGLSTHQREQLAVALRRPLGILCGSPGTGKSTVAATLAASLPAQHLAMCAPTGKAAVRITEILRQVAPGTTLAASTIHQLLGIDRVGYDGGGWGFMHDESNPLPHRYVILDEPSMLSTDLAGSFFRALKKGTHLLMVGDPDQLPPVGHGAPLRDLIACGAVPVGRLTEIHRNGGAIAVACAAMRAGRQDDVTDWAMVAPPGRVDLAEMIAEAAPETNWLHLEASSAERAAERLRELITWERPAIGAPAAARGLPASLQILAPVNSRGPLSCDAVNHLCQQALNPDDPHDPREIRAWGTRVRPGDRVVCLRNHWATDAANPNGRHYVANGEAGVAQSTGKPLVGVFNGNRVRMGRDEDDFALGYCITAHKSQGSEWPVTIVLLDSWNGRGVMGREWMYTALSRARSLCVTIGRLWTVRQAAGDQRLAVRRTFLDTRIREGVGRGEVG